MSDTLSMITPPLMVIELLIAEYMFTHGLTRRGWFWVAFIGYGLACVIITVWTEIAYVLITGRDFIYGGGVGIMSDSLFKLVFYCSIFIMTIACVFFSYKQTLTQILFCCAGAYATQHIARNVSSMIAYAPIFSNESYGVALTLLLDVVVYFVVYFAVYLLLIKPRGDNAVYNGNNKRKVIISLTVIIVCIVMSRLTNDIVGRTLLSTIAESTYSILSCALVLISQFGVSENDSMHYKVDSMTELLHQERKQYELSKETIDLINIKCHDLKHQISALRQNASEESIAEIEHAVMIYDSGVKTGNDVLDVILTEKKLQCESRNVQMTCMVKNDLISFMDAMDIYSLFGNAISNAIESVCELPDNQNRCVGVTVNGVGGMAVVHVENYFDGKLKIADGLPVTNKDADYHGFGMKSMARIARKYGGELTVSVADNKFNLDVVLPMPEPQAGDKPQKSQS